MPTRSRRIRGMSDASAVTVLRGAERSLVECERYWTNELLDCALIASSSAIDVQDTDPEKYDSYHVRLDYSAAGKAAGEGPVMRLLPLKTRKDSPGSPSSCMKLVTVCPASGVCVCGCVILSSAASSCASLLVNLKSTMEAVTVRTCTCLSHCMASRGIKKECTTALFTTDYCPVDECPTRQCSRSRLGAGLAHLLFVRSSAMQDEHLPGMPHGDVLQQNVPGNGLDKAQDTMPRNV